MSNRIKIPEAYREQNIWRWVGNLFFDYLCIFGAMILAREINHPLAYISAVIIIGARQHALGLLAHDGAHRLVTGVGWLNEYLWRPFTIWTLFGGAGTYRRFHFGHHKYSTTEQDPEVINKLRQGDLWSLPITRKKIIIDFIRDCFVLYLFNKKSTKTPEGVIPDNKEDVIGIGLFWMAVVTITFLTGGWYYLIMWLLPLPTSFIAYNRIRVWSEHTGINTTHRFETTWWQRFLFFPHNAWCHWEHHEYPDVPFFNLPKIHEEDRSYPVLPSFGALMDIFEKSLPVPSGKIGLKIPGAT